MNGAMIPFRASLALSSLLCVACGAGTRPYDTAHPPLVADIAAPAPTASISAGPASNYQGHGAESVSEATLKRFAPRPIDAGLSRRVQSLMDVRSPDAGILGTYTQGAPSLFFNWNVTGTPQVWRLDGPKGFPAQLTGGEDATTVVGVVPDGSWTVVQRDRSGEENPGLYLQRPQGGALEAIQHIKGVQTLFQLFSRDGKAIYYRANDQKPDAYALYRYDLATKTKTALLTEPGIWNIQDVHVDGRLLLMKQLGNTNTEYFELPAGTKTPSPLFGQGEGAEYKAKYGAAGEVIVRAHRGGNFRRLFRFSKGAFTPLTEERSWDIDSFDVSPDGKRVAFSVNEGGYTKLFTVPSLGGKARSLADFGANDGAWLGRFSKDSRSITVTVDPGSGPQKNYVVDLASRNVAEWTIPSAPEVDLSSYAKATLESYPARDGTQIPMWVRRPKACAAPCPVIVQFHGGPEAQAMPGFRAITSLFVDAGYILVEPNVRGSDGYGKAWLDADNAQKRLEVVSDIEDAATFIRKAWAKDGKAPRVGVMGGSYGGYSTMVAMTKFAGSYDVGVSIVGISSLLTFLENTAPYRRILRTSEYGDPDKDRAALIELSPTTHVDKVQGPMMIIHGATDPRVPAGEAIQMFEKIEKKGIPTELVIFPDEGHGARKRSNRVLMFGYTLEFFDKHLKK